ncbi:hypothetical protein [Myxacorys almedinensis]|uniref:Uncharacterized protein n=1 Tax=Myxacorys almedinensis A TaxID=2690445 RepID=A0A8J7Z7C1_9CYAN|nr:hypothetical protein [Myxacorys almedinensis]NDJ17743.1 hypothetical protein [Myxacorys almedinensis A]
MQDKQKVTLYLPPELHRQLKIRAAVASEAMSTLAEKALVFYLTHPEVVEQVEAAHGQAHRVYNCPGCTTPVVLRDGELAPLGQQSDEILLEEGLPAGEKIQVGAASESSNQETLVPC